MIPTETALRISKRFRGSVSTRRAESFPRREAKIDTSTQPGSPVVLVIDDDPVAGEIASIMLSAAGCTVHLAQDGSTALTLLERGYAPDLILVDAQLPGLSGKRLIAELRARGVSRICLASAGTPPEEMLAATDGFRRKPFDGDELLAAVGLGNRQLAQSAISPHEPSISDTPVLSCEVLEKFRQKMPDQSVRRIYSALVTDLNQRIQTLDEALASTVDDVDMDEVRRIGHAIHGGCAMAGAQQASALGAQLEAIPISASGNRTASAAAILRDLRTALQALEGKLKAEFPA
jgi:DNA-binding response OmpR family regulator